MIVLVTCKNEEDPIINEGARVLDQHYFVSIFRTLKGSSLRSSRSVLAEIPTHPCFYACPREEDPIKNEGAGVLTTVLPL